MVTQPEVQGHAWSPHFHAYLEFPRACAEPHLRTKCWSSWGTNIAVTALIFHHGPLSAKRTAPWGGGQGEGGPHAIDTRGDVMNTGLRHSPAKGGGGGGGLPPAAGC